MGYQSFLDTLDGIVSEVEATQGEAIRQAGALVAKSIMAGGILQSFGSGHSYAGAIEVAGRAGALIAAKVMEEPARGKYETIEGVGSKYMEESDVQPNDVFVIVSNSGRNPLPIEIAAYVKERGNPLIVVTSLAASREMTSRHSSGKKLYDYADVVLDNKGIYGDACVQLDGMPARVCATSSVTDAILLDCMMLEAIETMLAAGYAPPVYVSDNVDGGRQRNKAFVEKYAHRIQRK